MKESVSIETMTPKRAGQIIRDQEERIAKGMYRQRSLNKATVAKYVNDIKHGQWALNNQGIWFDEEGNLRDGRHRLWAIADAGIPVKILIFNGPAGQGNNGSSFNAVNTVDSGRARSIPQQLQMDGTTCAIQKASIIRCIGMLCSQDTHIKVGSIPTQKLLERYEKHIETMFLICHHKPAYMGSTLIGPLVLYRTINPEKADEFFTKFIEKTNLKSGSAVLAMIKAHENRITYGGTTATYMKAQNMCLALYHFDQGNTVQSIRNSNLGQLWLLEQCAKEVRKVREVIGYPNE